MEFYKEFGSLRRFLAREDRPARALDYHGVQGFLFAVVCAPDLVQPSEWLPIALGGNELGSVGWEEAQLALGEMMQLYNEINKGVDQGAARLPADCLPRLDAQANFGADAALGQWSRGFLRGHSWLRESWNDLIHGEDEREFTAILAVLCFFSSMDAAQTLVPDAEPLDFEAMATVMLKTLPNAIESYGHWGKRLRQNPEMETAAEEEPAQSSKISRNTPCPCGSGLKFKRCCGKAG